MTTPAPLEHSLMLSDRDVQMLVAMNAMFCAMVNRIADECSEYVVQQNIHSALQSYIEDYSKDEADALALRLRVLLPATTRLKFVAPSGDPFVH